MARNSVTLTFLGESRDLEKNIDHVERKLTTLDDSIKNLGRNTAKGGVIAGLGAGFGSIVAPLGAAGLALGIFGAVAISVLNTNKTATDGIKKAWGDITTAVTPAVSKIVTFAGKLLTDAAPSIETLANAGAKVIDNFLVPFDNLIKTPGFKKFVDQMANFAIQVSKLAGPQLVTLIGELMTLFIQVMPSGMQILGVLLPLIVQLVGLLTPFIVAAAQITATTLKWLDKTHLLIPVLATVAGLILILAGPSAPIWLLITAVLLLIAAGALLGRNWKKIWHEIVKVAKDAWAGVKLAANSVWVWLKALPGKIANVFSGIGHAIASPFIAGFNAIRNFWNSTLGGKGFSLPGWLGGLSFHLPYFHTGGIVGGSGDQLAMLRGGEGVFTREQMAAMGSTGSNKVVIEWAGGHAGDEFMTWLKKNIRVRGGDPAVMGAL